MVYRKLAQGGLAGFVATVPMTVAATLLYRHFLPQRQKYPLPPSRIMQRIERTLGIHSKVTDEQHFGLTMLGHFGYGTATGALYGLIAPLDTRKCIAGGVGYGLLVWAGSYLGLLPALGILSPATRHPLRRNILMIIAHLVWGLTLGGMIALLRSQELGEKATRRPVTQSHFARRVEETASRP